MATTATPLRIERSSMACPVLLVACAAEEFIEHDFGEMCITRLENPCRQDEEEAEQGIIETRSEAAQILIDDALSEVEHPSAAEEPRRHRRIQHSNLKQRLRVRAHHVQINSVEKRNARERTRVHTVNQAFQFLKQLLPSLKANTKRVSKLKILRASINYIHTLEKVRKFPLNPTWWQSRYFRK